MKILNFLPLLAWMLFFPLTIIIGDKIQGHAPTESGIRAVAGAWLFGGVLWFIIGVVFSA